MSAPEPLPAYRDLPRVDGTEVRSAWGLFGTDDSLGLMNLMTPERILAAARLVRRGAVFPLDLPVGAIDPPLFRRGAARHHLFGAEKASGLDDVVDNFFPQAGSQWDALAHVGYELDSFYNGATTADVRAGRDTIDNIAERGIVGRGILLDVADVVAERGGPGESVAVTVADLEDARERAGVELRAGDVVLLHTGYVEWHQEQPMEVRRAQSNPATLTATGLAHGTEMVEYLWDAGVVAVVGDTAGGEVWPPDHAAGPTGSLHRLMISQLGMMIGELWQLGDLARDCRADGVHEFLLVSSPWNLPGGIGSPANALAIK